MQQKSSIPTASKVQRVPCDELHWRFGQITKRTGSVEHSMVLQGSVCCMAKAPCWDTSWQARSDLGWNGMLVMILSGELIMPALQDPGCSLQLQFNPRQT